MAGSKLCLVVATQRLLRQHLPPLQKPEKKLALSVQAAAKAAKAVVRADERVVVAVSAAGVAVAASAVATAQNAVTVPHAAKVVASRAVSNAMNNATKAVSSALCARVKLLSVRPVKAVAKADAVSAAAEAAANAVTAHHAGTQRLRPTQPLLKAVLLAQCPRWTTGKTPIKPTEANAHPAKHAKVAVSHVKAVARVQEVGAVAAIVVTVLIAQKANTLHATQTMVLTTALVAWQQQGR